MHAAAAFLLLLSLLATQASQRRIELKINAIGAMDPKTVFINYQTMADLNTKGRPPACVINLTSITGSKVSGRTGGRSGVLRLKQAPGSHRMVIHKGDLAGLSLQPGGNYSATVSCPTSGQQDPEYRFNMPR